MNLHAHAKFDLDTRGLSRPSNTNGASDYSEFIKKRVISNVVHNARRPGGEISGNQLPEFLFDARADFKIRAAAFARYFEGNTREKLFYQIDKLLDSQNWDDTDHIPTGTSFATFFRMFVFLSPARRPGLGLTSEGNVVAMWTVDTHRLTLICEANDRIQWVVSMTNKGEIETGAGRCDIARLKEVLSPYSPQIWFS